MLEEAGKWRLAFFVLLFAVAAFGNAVVGFILGRESQPSENKDIAPTPIVTIPATPTPTIDRTSLIKQAVYAKTELDETEAEIFINEIRDQFVKGGIREFGAVSGAYFIGAKTEDSWVIVYVGQANPTCEEIDPYNFPTDLVPECIDATDKVITR